MFKKLFSLCLTGLILMSALCVTPLSVSAEEGAPGKVVLVSFDDGSYSRLLNGEIKDKLEITDKVAYHDGGKSLKFVVGNDPIFLFGGFNIEDLPGTKTLKIRYKYQDGYTFDPKGGPGGNGNHRVTFDFSNVLPGGTSGKWSSYPLSVNNNNWKDEGIPLDSIKSKGYIWNDSLISRLKIRNSTIDADTVIYIDSIWIEYTGYYSGDSSKSNPGTKTVADFNTNDQNTLPVATDGEGVKNFNGSLGNTDIVDTGSTYAYKTSMKPSNGRVFCYRGISGDGCITSLQDWTDYDKICFRMRAVGDGISADAAKSLIIGFSRKYVTVPSNCEVTTSCNVYGDAFRDYKFNTADIVGKLATDQKNSISITMTQGSDAVDGSNLYIDRIWLEKTPEATLSAPTCTLDSANAVNRYLEGENKITFTFDKDIEKADYNNAVRVYSAGVLSNEAFSAMADGNKLTVTFADALKENTEYNIVLKAGKVLSTDFKTLASDYEYPFTTTAKDLTLRDLRVEKSETNASAKLTVDNNTENGYKCYVIIAAYDSDNTLVDFAVSDSGVGAVSTNDITAAIDDISALSGCTYKAFAWDSISGMMPLCPSAAE